MTTTPGTPSAVADNYTNRFNLGVTLRWLRTGRNTITISFLRPDGPALARVRSVGAHGLTTADLGSWVFILAGSNVDGLHRIANIIGANEFTIALLGDNLDREYNAGLVAPQDAHFGYEIEWDRTNTGSWVLVQRIHQSAYSEIVGTSTATSSYRHLYVQPGREHRYRLRAIDCLGTASSYTAILTTNLAALPDPLTPPALTVYRPAAGYAVLDWTVDNADAKRYEVERSENNGSWQRIFYSSSPEVRTTYSDLTLSAGSSYRYRVRHRYTKNSTPTIPAADWQNKDDPLDLNNDGAVDYRDFRLLWSWIIDRWPDFGNSLENPNTGSTHPNRNPATDPPVISAAYAPLGALLDASGDDAVSPIDTSLLTNHANAVASYPARSDWSNVASAAAPVHGWHLYLAANNGVFRTWLDGRNLENLGWGHTPPLANCRAISVDRSRAQVYYLAHTTASQLIGDIWRDHLHGSSEPEIVLSGQGRYVLAVDEIHGKLYFDAPGELLRCNLDGSGVETVILASASLGVSADLRGLVVDPYVNNLLFFIEHNSGDIWKSNLDGTNAQRIYTAGSVAARALAYNQVDNRLYFATTAVDRRVRRINLDGSGITTILDGEHFQALAFDYLGEKILWYSDRGLRRASYTGSLTETLSKIDGGCLSGVVGLATYQYGDYPEAGPTGLTAEIDGKYVELAWSVAGLPTNHQYLEIQRLVVDVNTDECDWRFVQSLTDGVSPIAVSTYRDNYQLEHGKTYRYRVRSTYASLSPAVPTRAWQNRLPLDVVNDGIVGMEDYQRLLDYLNASGAGSLPETRPEGQPFYDVNGDGAATSLDSQLIAGVFQSWTASGPPTFWSTPVEITYTTTTTPYPIGEIDQTLPPLSQALAGRAAVACEGLYFVSNRTSNPDRVSSVTYSGSPPTADTPSLEFEADLADASQKIRNLDTASLNEYGVIFYVIQQVQLGSPLWWLRKFDVTTEIDHLLLSRPAPDPSLYPADIVSDHEQQAVYYAQLTELWRTDFAGGSALLMRTASRSILGVRIDCCNQRLYWTEKDLGVYTGRVQNTGTPQLIDVVQLISGGSPTRLDVAQGLNRLVFVDTFQQRLYVADLDGVIYGYLSLGSKAADVRSVVIDQDTACVFYSVGGTTPAIWVVEDLLSGSPAPTETLFLAPAGLDDLTGVSLCNNYCYEVTTTTTTLHPPGEGDIAQTLPPIQQNSTGEVSDPTTTTTTPVPDCENIFWLDSLQRQMQRAEFDGSGRTALASHGSNYGQIQLDPDAGYVYWVDTSAAAIYRSRTDGTGVETLVSGLANPYGLVLNPTAGHLYWGDATLNKVERANLDGSGRTVILPNGTFGELRHLAIDRTNNRLYYCDLGLSSSSTDGAIWRSNLTGGSLTAVVTGLTAPLGVAVDPALGYLYYADSGDFEIHRTNLNGGSDSVLYTMEAPAHLVFDLVVEDDGETLWWCQPYQKWIVKARRDGAHRTVAIDLSPLIYFQANSLAICGLSDPLGTTTTTTTTTTTPSPGDIRQRLPAVRQSLDGDITATTTTSTTYEPEYCYGVYLTDPARGEVGATNRGSGGYLPLYDGFSNPVALASNTAEATVYLLDQGTSRLWSLAMDGSTQTLIADLSGTYTNLRGLAYHATGDRLYFVDRQQKKLLSVGTGGGTPTVVATGLNRPLEVAVDPVDLRVYWSDDNVIRRVKLDGTSAEDFLVDRNAVLGIDVDAAGRQLYWVEGGSNEVYRANLDDGLPVLIRAGLRSPRSIRVDSVLGQLLVTETDLSTIVTMSLDGEGLDYLATQDDVRPYSLALCVGATDSDFPTTTTSEPGTTTTTPEPGTTTTTTTTTPEPTTTTTTTTTCEPDPGVVDGGRVQISVDQPQGGQNYPFVGQPSDDLDLLIADLYLYYVDSICGLTPPFRIDWLSCFGTEAASRPDSVCRCNPYDLRIIDRNDQPVFDTREATLTRNVMWGSTLRVVEWVTDDGSILRVVKFEGWDPNRTPRNWPEYLEPTSAILDPRTVQSATPTITSLEVDTVDEDNQPESFLVDTRHGLILAGGYNVELARLAGVNADGQPLSHTISLSAEANGGLGRYPGCAAPDAIYSINDSTPNERGNLTLDAPGCYRVQPIVKRVVSVASETDFEIVEIERGKLLVTNDCGPCCTCEDFSRVYEAIRRVWLKYKQLGKRAEAVRDLYEANIARWEANRACRAGTTLRCVMLPVYPCRAAIGIGLCNNTDAPLRDVEIEIDFGRGGTTAGGCVVCGATLRRGNLDAQRSVPTGIWQPYKLIGEFPVLRAKFDCIGPGELGTIVTQLEFPDGSDGDQVCAEFRIVRGDGQPDNNTSRCCTGLICQSSEGCCEVGNSSSLSAPAEPEPGTAGNLHRVVNNFSTGTCRLLAASGTPHQLSVGDRVQVLGSSVAAYNTTHTITQLVSLGMSTSPAMVTDIPFTTTAQGGTYRKI